VPNDEGGYRVVARATHPRFQREALGAFAVLEGRDGNGNRLPDVWEEENNVSDPGGDPDLDGLTNYWEYMHGTDPHNPDTDGGGEKDGSEVAGGRDPLDPADDGIRAPSFFQVRPVLAMSPAGGVLVPAVRLEYDWQAEYDGMWYYRATNPSGPWGDPMGLPTNSGVYSDTAVTPDTTYWYRLEAAKGEARAEPVVSAVLTSEAVIPAEDPYPPEAHVLINGGAAWTPELDVTLSFVPYESEGGDPPEVFEDIAWVKLSNDPSFVGAEWQAFAPELPWHLEAEPGQVATVYALFRDEANNDSVAPEAARILHSLPIYLPLVLRNY